MDPDALLAHARKAQAGAYAPYSGYRVGAALLSRDGRVFSAGNVENASYGLTVCAERVAVFTALAAGCRDFEAIAVVTDGMEPVAPCGACRQVLVEFAPALAVISEAREGRVEWSLDTLHPEPFREVPRLGNGKE